MRLLLIFGLIWAPALAGAQEPQAEAGIVDACFAAAPRGRIDPDCIGIAANLCQSQPGRSDTVSIGGCLMSEMAEWDRILNREYTATRDAYAARTDAPGLVDSLKVAQRAWIALRDADCSVAYDRYGGGSMRSIASAECEMTHTARRALDLKNMREY